MFTAQLVLQNLLEMTEKVIKIYITALRPKKVVLSTQSESLLECGKHIDRETRSAKATTKHLYRCSYHGSLSCHWSLEKLWAQSQQIQRRGQEIKALLLEDPRPIEPLSTTSYSWRNAPGRIPKTCFLTKPKCSEWGLGAQESLLTTLQLHCRLAWEKPVHPGFDIGYFQ